MDNSGKPKGLVANPDSKGIMYCELSIAKTPHFPMPAGHVFVPGDVVSTRVYININNIVWGRSGSYPSMSNVPSWMSVQTATIVLHEGDKQVLKEWAAMINRVVIMSERLRQSRDRFNLIVDQPAPSKRSRQARSFQPRLGTAWSKKLLPQEKALLSLMNHICIVMGHGAVHVHAKHWQAAGLDPEEANAIAMMLGHHLKVIFNMEGQTSEVQGS